VMVMGCMPKSETGTSLASSVASASLTSDTKRPGADHGLRPESGAMHYTWSSVG
jgi:hypothetical protein